MSTRTHRRTRRGSNAVEFALVFPVLLTLLLGMIDYGWFYLNQTFAVEALREAVRLGSLQVPSDTDAIGERTPCVDVAADYALTMLARYRIPVDPETIAPEIISVDGTCALSLEPVIPFEPVGGLVPTPASFKVDTVMVLQNVGGC